MTQKLILKRMQFPTIHLHIPRSKYALTRSYESGHYRSFLKINKNTFVAKAYNLRMEYKNEMRPRGLVRGHLKVFIIIMDMIKLVSSHIMNKILDF